MPVALRAYLLGSHSLAEGALKLLYTLIGKHSVQALAYHSQVVLYERIAPMLRLLSAPFIRVGHPEVHKQRILRCTGSHQLPVITEYISALGCNGHTILDPTATHLTPVVALEHHHREGFAQYGQTDDGHKDDDGKVA